MTRPLKIYLAGPEVFLPDAAALGVAKKALCVTHGFEGLFPFDGEAAPQSGTRLDLVIYRADVALMREADLGIFNLTPFRGVSADVGTAFELGMFAGLGKPSFAYTNDPVDLLGRVRRIGILAQDAIGAWRDQQSISVEDFGSADNLMLEMTLAEQGRAIVRHSAAPDRLFADLTGFEACLRQAAEALVRRS
jgi:nucleoside 2-deoxyribosyltransferase